MNKIYVCVYTHTYTDVCVAHHSYMTGVSPGTNGSVSISFEVYPDVEVKSLVM